MNFKHLFNQLPSMKHYFIVTGLIFAVGIYMGYTSPEQFQFILNAAQERLKSIVNSVNQAENRTLALFGAIFLNNVIALCATIALGGFFMILPIYFLLINGALLGYFAEQFVQKGELDAFLKGIVPHGIIEIPAICIAAAFGIRFGVLVIKGLIKLPYASRRKQAGRDFGVFFKQILSLLVILIGLLAVAALIESTVSVWLTTK